MDVNVKTLATELYKIATGDVLTQHEKLALMQRKIKEALGV